MLSIRPASRLRLALAGPVLCGVLASLAGCGYALVGRGNTLPSDVRAIYVQPLVNETQRSQVEQFLTNAIVDELVTRQRYQVLSSTEGADAALTGTVTSFNAVPVTFDAEGRAEEYEISIIARMAFKRTGSEQQVLWANDRYLFRENYRLDVSQAGYFDQEDAAIEQVAAKFAQTMVSDLLEGF